VRRDPFFLQNARDVFRSGFFISWWIGGVDLEKFREPAKCFLAKGCGGGRSGLCGRNRQTRAVLRAGGYNTTHRRRSSHKAQTNFSPQTHQIPPWSTRKKRTTTVLPGKCFILTCKDRDFGFARAETFRKLYGLNNLCASFSDFRRGWGNE